MPKGSQAQQSLLLGAGMAEPFWKHFRGRMLLCFFHNPHAVVTQSHAWSPFRDVRGQSLEIKSFTQPLLCLGEFFLYSAEEGKPGGQYMPRNSPGLLPPEPKPPTTCLQHNCLSTHDASG